jgi:hypothetical protein
VSIKNIVAQSVLRNETLLINCITIRHLLSQYRTELNIKEEVQVENFIVAHLFQYSFNHHEQQLFFFFNERLFNIIRLFFRIFITINNYMFLFTLITTSLSCSFTLYFLYIIINEFISYFIYLLSTTATASIFSSSCSTAYVLNFLFFIIYVSVLFK